MSSIAMRSSLSVSESLLPRMTVREGEDRVEPLSW